MDTRIQQLDEDPWYGWDCEAEDQGWLLTYVDLLSVILCMLLVLLVNELQIDKAQNSPGVAPSSMIESISASEPLIAPAVTPAPVELELELENTLVNTMPLRIHSPSLMLIDGVTVIPDEMGITVKVDEVVLFESAQANLKPGAKPVLTQVANLLDELGEIDISVEGHTDDQQILGGVFGSNWELAAARSSAVTTFLLEQGLAADHLRVVSYAETRPIADNNTAEGRAQNRRVELHIQFLNPEVLQPNERKDESFDQAPPTPLNTAGVNTAGVTPTLALITVENKLLDNAENGH